MGLVAIFIELYGVKVRAIIWMEYDISAEECTRLVKSTGVYQHLYKRNGNKTAINDEQQKTLARHFHFICGVLVKDQIQAARQDH